MQINPRVIVVREAIKILIPMLTERDIRVTQQGSSAFVKWDKHTLEPVQINVPYVPDDGSDDLLDAVQGFLDHEVAHILFTDSAVVKRAADEGVHFVHNVIEDTRIERLMRKRFPGSAHNLDHVGEFFCRTRIQKSLDDGIEATRALFMPMMRAWAGQRPFADFMSDKWHLMEDMTGRIGEDFPAMVKAIETNEDALNLALELKRRLKKDVEDEHATPSQSEQGKEDGGKDSKPGGNGKPKDADNSSEKKNTKSDKKGKKKKKDKGDKPKDQPKDDAGKGSDGTEKADVGKKDDRGDDAGAEKGDDQDGEEPPSGGDEGSEAGAGKDGESEDDGGKSDSEGDRTTSNDAEDHRAGSDSDEQFDKSGKGNSGAGDGEVDDPQGGPADDFDPSNPNGENESNGKSQASDDGVDQSANGGGVTGQSGEGGEPGENDAPGSEDGTPDYYDNQDFDSRTDFDNGVAEEISAAVRDASEHADYLIFTTDEDVLEPLDYNTATVRNKSSYLPSVPFADQMVTDLVDAVDHLVGPMQKDMMRAVAARSAAQWTGGHRSGRLHAGSLFRLRFNDPRVFRRKQENETKDVDVMLLIDGSGSMLERNKIGLAAQVGYGLSSVLDLMNINHEVLCFTTKPFSDAVMALANAEYEKNSFSYSRLEALYMPLIKGFGERFSSDTKRRFAALAHARFCWCNVDGESVQIAARRLTRQKGKRKIMLVLSDGEPHAAGHTPALRAHLKAVVKEVEKSGIDVVGIGVLDEEVREFYTKSVVIKNLNDLPGTVMQQIKRLLLK